MNERRPGASALQLSLFGAEEPVGQVGDQVRPKPDATDVEVRLKPDTTDVEVRRKRDVTDVEVRLKPDTTDVEVRLKPDATDVEVRLKPDVTDVEVRLTPDATDVEVRLTPDTTDVEVRLTPDTTDVEIRLKPDATDVEVRLKPDATDVDVRLTPDTTDVEVRLKPDATDVEVRLTPDTTDVEARLKPDATDVEVRLKPDTTDVEVRRKRDVTDVEVRLKPDTTDAEVRLKPDATDVDVRLTPDTTDVEVRLTPDATDVEVQPKPDATDVEVRVKPDATNVELRPKPDPAGVDVRPKPDTTGVPTEVMTAVATVAARSEVAGNPIAVAAPGTVVGRPLQGRLEPVVEAGAPGAPSVRAGVEVGAESPGLRALAATSHPPEAAVPVPVAAPAAADPDAGARDFAIDPHHNVVLEASAGTGKTSVLVWRYVNLLKAGIEPGNILAITFTRKAAAEMRERIIRELKDQAARSEFDHARWVEVRDRLGDISISTIDAFCLSLLREFPLEADLDPGFEMADETEVPRLVDESLDRSLRIFAGLAKQEPDIAVVLAQLGVARTREGLASLLERRLVAWDALDRFLARGPSDLTAEIVCRRAAISLQDALRAVPGGLAKFLLDGPLEHPRYQMLVRDLRRLGELERAGDAQIRAVLDRVAAHFLTNEGKARQIGAIPPYRTDRDYPSAEASKRHRSAVAQIAPHIRNVVVAFGRDLNVVLARGVRRMFGIALAQYRRALEERSVLDFSDVLQRALDLLRQMDEFSQSRFRLESRYHHVLVDEFQDTSRAQWELVSLLIQSWGEGLGLATHPSIFIVGDRKQSIYRFRDAEVAVLQEAGRYIEALRPAGRPHRSISRSFRALPELLEFVNELFSEMSQSGARADDFTYRDPDRFPIDIAADRVRGPVLGLAVADDPDACAAAVAAEIERILREETVRDRKSGVPRQARPGDIAILFRSRASHREFEHELGVRGIPSYVYKGLGFFDADEIKDLSALMRYLADPGSDLRAAAFLRSRFVRLSDRGLAQLGPRLAAAMTGSQFPDAVGLEDEDRRVLEYVRARVGEWLAQVDRVPPADLIEQLLPATAYAYELRGPRRLQAWENLKKMRGLVRRIQNRGYATLARIADHIESLTAGDESNAVIEALDAVNLMTVHASKGLEFPVVFVVNLARGATGPARPIRVVTDGEGGAPSVSVGPFVSETDEAEREREKQETRRLMYVALTRARDRLYLSSALKDRVLQPGRGSLAEVLPDSVKLLFGRAATSFDECDVLGWAGQSGRPFDWRLCRVPGAVVPAQGPAPVVSEAAADDSADRFGPVEDHAGVERLPVTRWLRDSGATEASRAAGLRDSTAGILVHRLLQFGNVSGGAEDPGEFAYARGLLKAEERAAVEDVDATVAAAVDAWRSLRSRSDIAELFASGRRLHEIPFSFFVAASAGSSAPPPSPAVGAGSHAGAASPKSIVLRGTIDCLIQKEDGSIVVVEFKTGRPRPTHRQQLDLYVEAARHLFPGATVDGRLIYADPPRETGGGDRPS